MESKCRGPRATSTTPSRRQPVPPWPCGCGLTGHSDDGTRIYNRSNIEFTDISAPAGEQYIPGSASARLNIRFNNLHRGADLVRMVEETAVREAPGSKIVAKISGEAFLTPPGELYDLVVEAIRDETGCTPNLSTGGGTSDGRYLIQLCPVVDFGLPNGTMHKLDESAARGYPRSVADL